MEEQDRFDQMRRDFLRRAAWGGLAFGNLVCWPAFASPQGLSARAKSVIQIWMWGGASQLDTFDPKPEAGSDYCGPFSHPLETNVKGMRIGEKLPLLARCADKYSLIRSMTHGVNAHETASYIVQTGWPSGGGLVHPCAGAVVSYFRGLRAGYKSLIPPYIVLTEPQGRFSEEGFLGLPHKPFATGGDPAQPRFAVQGIVLPGISEARQRSRRQLLGELDSLGHELAGDPALMAWRETERIAYELILGDGGKVFDLSQESEALRDRYGRSTFGQSCLAARRLVERGVPYVTINYQGGWDTHKENFQQANRRLPEFDRGLAALLGDLAERGLLDSTIVWCCGEFGRTPKVSWEAPWNGGRHHWGQVFSALLAGGGFRGGEILGSSDARGETVRDRPVHPVDLLASIYTLLGIDPRAELPAPDGGNVPVLPELNKKSKYSGILSEIMSLRS